MGNVQNPRQNRINGGYAMTVSKNEMDELARIHGMKAWAYVLQLRDQRGDQLNANQVRCYRIALGLDR